MDSSHERKGGIAKRVSAVETSGQSRQVKELVLACSVLGCEKTRQVFKYARYGRALCLGHFAQVDQFEASKEEADEILGPSRGAELVEKNPNDLALGTDRARELLESLGFIKGDPITLTFQENEEGALSTISGVFEVAYKYRVGLARGKWVDMWEVVDIQKAAAPASQLVSPIETL